MSDTPEFQLGIVMAGAVSAGAYSAGVMDFIFEALDAYEEEKRKSSWDGPTHDVRIPVMSGTSAGGMTAAMCALQAFNSIAHVQPGLPPPEPAANRLYSSWVSDISIARLLETTDIDAARKNGGLASALCSNVLDQILKDVFAQKGPLQARNWIGHGDDRSLRLLITATNLRGVPYAFSIFGADGNEQYGMLNHGDYLDFTVGMGTKALPDSHALDINNTSAGDWSLFKIAALATGAFPVGLAARQIARPPSDYKRAVQVVCEDPMGNFAPISPDRCIDNEKPYNFISVDGGVVDNEPLELARRTLAGGIDQQNPRGGQDASRAVLLIAPFPNFVNLPPFDSSSRVLHLLPGLVTALLQQARFKPSELSLAADDTVFSRFIISPIRHAGANPEAVKYPIASGVLAGFGGFFHESFRRHDYLLGRRNAQAFLRWHFALPENNNLFNGFQGDRARWYVRNVDGATAPITADDSQFAPKLFATTVKAIPDTKGLPIIPLVERLRIPIEIGPADLPRPAEVDQTALAARIRTRAEAVIEILVDVDLLAETNDLLIGAPLRWAARRYATEIVTRKATRLVQRAIEELKKAF
jgi:patatin-like phospholipase